MSLAILAILALSGTADAQSRDHSHLIPTFECSWSDECTRHHTASDATLDLQAKPRYDHQFGMGMTGLFDPVESGTSLGSVIVNDLPSGHYEEHWFIDGAYDWTNGFIAEYEGVKTAAPAYDYDDLPYLYMNIHYTDVPDEGLTMNLTYSEPTEVERLTFEMIQYDAFGDPQVVASLLREHWLAPVDAYKDYWLFTSNHLVLDELNEKATLQLSDEQLSNPTQFFDKHGPASVKYTLIKYKESIGSNY